MVFFLEDCIDIGEYLLFIFGFCFENYEKYGIYWMFRVYVIYYFNDNFIFKVGVVKVFKELSICEISESYVIFIEVGVGVIYGNKNFKFEMSVN